MTATYISKTKMSKKQKPKCIIPKCDNKAKIRGLCKCDYAATRRLINAGIYDEKKMLKNGSILPRRMNIYKDRTANIIEWIEDCEKKAMRTLKK